MNLVVTNEGNNIDNREANVDDCKSHCDERSDCESFTHCSDGFYNNCHLKNKNIDATDATTRHDPFCTTYYRDCSK